MMERRDTGETPYILPSGKPITGTLVWYYVVCKREVWLMGREIRPDESSEMLDFGRSVHETFYSRVKKETLQLEGVRIDFVKRRERIICEVKTSSRYLEATRMQVAYYLYRLNEMGVRAMAEILIPRERKKFKIFLDRKLKDKVVEVLHEIRRILEMGKPPPPP